MAIAYFVWSKIITMYLKMWKYQKRGIYSFSTPVPLIGNLMAIKKAMDTQNEYSKAILNEVYDLAFGENYPKMHIGFIIPQHPSIIVNDPEIVNELYVTKNKYYDKDPRSKASVERLFGDSTIF